MDKVKCKLTNIHTRMNTSEANLGLVSLPKDIWLEKPRIELPTF